MPKWRFVLRNNNDLSKIGELAKASSKKVDLVLNKTGSANFNYPMSGQYAESIIPYATAVSAERYNWRATRVMNNAGTRGEVWDWIFGGFVQPIKETWHEDMMAVSVMGWAERLNKRVLRRDKTWTSMDDGPILQDVLAEMNLTTAPDGYAIPVVAGSNPATPTWMTWGGTVPNEGVGGATAYVAHSPLTLTKPKYQTKALQVFDEITQIENGCDWWVHPKTRVMYVARRRMVDRPEVVVSYQWGMKNLSEFERDIAAEEQANYFVTTGNSQTIPQYAHDLTSQAIVGILEETAALSDVGSNSVLLANSGAEIIVRENGKITYGITPFAYKGDIDDEPNSVPEPFVDYTIGDLIRASARHAKRGIITRQSVRVFGMSVTIDDNGNETLGQLQVAP